MQRNIEIKAKLKNRNRLLEKIIKLCDAENTKAIELEQLDIFYRVNIGRLKLRHFGTGQESELIAYERPNEKGPKLSSYTRVPMATHTAELLDKALTSALGVSMQVKKNRLVYLIGQSRLHIDQVEGLGDFIEIEVVLKPNQTIDDGQLVMNKLITELGIQTEDLINTAYADLLNNKKLENEFNS